MQTKDKISNLILECENELSTIFTKLDEVALFNQEKVLAAFQNNKISLRHFQPSTGYGYGDEGKIALSKLFADIFKAQDAIVSPSIVSGTHALSLALFSCLMPGDNFLCITGKPYDTLIDVIFKEGSGSLIDYNIKCNIVNLLDDQPDIGAIFLAVQTHKPKLVYIQRSRGYDWRQSLSIEDIETLCKSLRDIGFDGTIMVDNCYGEFCQTREPIEVGADLVAGSLIKNPGGGIAMTGGYVLGNANLVERAKNRLTAPSIGFEVGSYAQSYQNYFQGLFLAPHTVLQALKGASLFNAVFKKLGFKTSPSLSQPDIITAIEFKSSQNLIKFINSVQQSSPVDSYLTVEPWDMPGYNHKVIMAAGCFVQGSSIELSADSPIKEPYIGYVQGGLTYEHCKIAIQCALQGLNVM